MKNHPLPDGNKRVAWLALVEFVERNGYALHVHSTDDAVATMIALAAGDLSEGDFVYWARAAITEVTWAT